MTVIQMTGQELTRLRIMIDLTDNRRRECLGELVQIDGWEHAWFEDRGDTCTTRRCPENVSVAEIESG
jgi:hypothetical protein